MTEQEELRNLNAAVMDARDHLRGRSFSKRPSAHSQLALLLYQRFGITGDPRDLNEAIRGFEDAIRLSSFAKGVTDQARLAAALYHRFKLTNDLADLNRAHSLAERVVELEPDDHNRSMFLSNLAMMRFERFQVSGKVEELRSTIAALEQAIESAYLDEDILAVDLSNLSVAMKALYDLSGDRTDLDRAINAARNAVALPSSSERERANRLVMLGSALMEAGREGNDPAILDETISLFRQAVADDDVLDSPARTEHLVALSYALSLRFARNRDREDLDQAVDMLRVAVSITPRDSRMLDELTILLSANLERRFEISDNYSDLSEAIDLVRWALYGSKSPSSQHRPLLMLNLGMLLAKRSELPTAQSGDLSDGLFAISSIISEKSLELTARVAAVRVAGWHAVHGGDWVAAIGLFKSMLNTIGDNYFGSNQLDNGDLIAELASDAAACAIAAGDLSEALALFDAGRFTALTAERERREVVQRLRWVSPSVAHRMSRVLIPLEGFPREWDELVAEIRQLDEFDTFMRVVPSRIEVDLGSAEVAVAVNVSEYGSFALIAHASGIRTVSLPALSKDSSVSYVENYVRDVLQGRSVKLSESQLAAERTLSDTLSWMADTIVRPIAREIESLSDGNSEPSRVLWCPGNPISILPIHAVGTYLELHGDVQPGLRGSSTYIPSLRFLRGVEKYRNFSIDPELQPFVVLAGGGPDAVDLVASSLEITAIRRGFSESHTLKGVDVNIDNMTNDLGGRPLVHFSGHGYWEPSDPFASGLMLYDGVLTTERLLQLDAGRVNLAVLSASCTALGSVRHPGAFVHPAAALLAAGVDNVVGTVLSVRDRAAGEFASEFYRILAAGPPMDSGWISHAVSEAVRRLAHKYPNTPTSWVPFVHLGK